MSASMSTAPVPLPRVRMEGSNLVPATESTDLAHELAAVMGLQDAGLAVQSFQNLLNAIPREGQDKAVLANTIIAMLAELKPRDALEATLAAQIVATSVHSLSLLTRACSTNLEGLAESRYALAEKLLKLNLQQVRTLDAHRRQGQQHMRIEHVHIHEGSQAIIGVVNRGGHS